MPAPMMQPPEDDCRQRDDDLPGQPVIECSPLDSAQARRAARFAEQHPPHVRRFR